MFILEKNISQGNNFKNILDMKKYNIFSTINKEVEERKENDLTLALESSSVLQSERYLSNRTRIKINFMKYTDLNVMKLFFVTITSKISDMEYRGFDSSCRCILRNYKKFKIGIRYAIYGKLKKETYLILDVADAFYMDYKELINQIL